MDNVSEKLGLYDFFNVISVGAIFILHIVFLFPNTLSIYDDWINDGVIKFAGLFILSYLLGLLFQELGSILDENKIFKQRFLKEKLTKTFLTRDDIIDNRVKLELYREYAKDILKMKNIKFERDFTPEQNGYIYSYVEYFIEHKGRNKKFEKMRALYGMSKALLCCMPFIISACIFGAIPTIRVAHSVCIGKIIGIPIYALISMIIYYLRARRCMKYRIRMMMGVYEACIEFGKDGYTK